MKQTRRQLKTQLKFRSRKLGCQFHLKRAHFVQYIVTLPYTTVLTENILHFQFCLPPKTMYTFLPSFHRPTYISLDCNLLH